MTDCAIIFEHFAASSYVNTGMLAYVQNPQNAQTAQDILTEYILCSMVWKIKEYEQYV